MYKWNIILYILGCWTVCNNMLKILSVFVSAGIPQMAIITNVDEACGETEKNLRNVYRSKHVKKKVSPWRCECEQNVQCENFALYADERLQRRRGNPDELHLPREELQRRNQHRRRRGRSDPERAQTRDWLWRRLPGQNVKMCRVSQLSDDIYNRFYCTTSTFLLFKYILLKSCLQYYGGVLILQ